MSVVFRGALTCEAELLLVDHDPAVTATDCQKGSIIIEMKSSPDDVDMYLKKDNGNTTNVKKVTAV